ncbi:MULTISPECIES: hypothetical protein [unclassified Streptomyces]|uniref:hypothetical protein n=1 Tax=unclassified Streptomyces TaxID=2593676 RepID=UPI00278C3A64|nr:MULTISPECIES: hypothetical protein [unclassified Streptomyces]
MTDLERLASFPATGRPGTVFNDWATAESALRVRFPPTFKRFLDVLGGAKFDDFLLVYLAGAHNKNVDLLTQTTHTRASVTRTTSRRHIHELLAERGVEPTQLIRWGGTDNADMCFLIPHPDPCAWAVLVVEGRGNDYDLFEGPVESYLLRVMCGDFVSSVFPDDFPDACPFYERRTGI